jgi:hypothetical protein
MKDETFYVVAATVIPVYFLALTLQGTFYDKIQSYFEVQAKKSLAGWQETFSRPRVINPQFIKTYLRTRPRALILSLALVIAAFAIILSAIAEAFAIIALYNGYAYQYVDGIVLSALLLLTTGTALLILIRIYMPIITYGLKASILVWRKAHVSLAKEARARDETSQSKEEAQ